MSELEEKRHKARFYLMAAGNTANPALLILQNKGYDLGFEPASEISGLGTWWAERDGNLFEAEDSLLLLGLVSIWENRGENWQNKDNEPFLWDELQGL